MKMLQLATVVFVSVRTVRERVRGPCSYNCMSTGHAHAHALFERKQKQQYVLQMPKIRRTLPL